MNREETLATVAASLRWDLKMLSPLNQKSVKGESLGYLQAMLYLAPATEAGGRTVCPHSTPACRDGCLFTAGRGKTTTVRNARVRRTRLYLDNRDSFFDELIGELTIMQSVADQHSMKLVIRLNGTSDILWERELIDGRPIFDMYPRAIFMDYTRAPAAHRKVPPNWHLTFSLSDQGPEWAVAALRAGLDVAAIVPDAERANAPAWFMAGDTAVHVIDGEEHDLRFLDPSPALVLLRPKGRLAQTPGSPMVHEHLIQDLIRLGRQ